MFFTPCRSSSKADDAALEQRATVLGRLDALGVAVEQPHAERLLQICDRSRNGGLGGVQELRRLSHAAGLHHRHQDVQVLQLHPASDAIAQLHLGIPHCRIDMAIIKIITLLMHSYIVRYVSGTKGFRNGRRRKKPASRQPASMAEKKAP